MPDQPQPPTARYRFTLTITGNTLDEIEHELRIQTRGGFLDDSNHGSRDAWHVIGSRAVRVMEHRNPDMTPERYRRELNEWCEARRAARRADQTPGE